MPQELVTDCDVLILGGSMAGIELVHQLRRSPAARALRIVVIDRQAVHGYIPLAHERLCLRLPMSASELATAQQVENAGYRYVLGELVGFDVQTKTVELASGERVSGRFVVVALGSALAAPHWLPPCVRFSRTRLTDDLVDMVTAASGGGWCRANGGNRAR